MQGPKCALFIDCENVPVSFFPQVISALEPYQVCAKKAYANWQISTPWSEILDKFGIEPVQVFHRGLKNSSDLRLSLDCLQIAYERTDITHFALVTSDSDFRHLVFKLLDLGRAVIGFGESKISDDFAGVFSSFHLLKKQIQTPKIEAQEKIENKQVEQKANSPKDEFLTVLIWACASFDGFTSINKINSKMIAHFGKDWGMRKTKHKSWARFFKMHSAFFEVCYEDKEKHTGMSVRLKENALLKM